MNDKAIQFNKLTAITDITALIRDVNLKSISVIEACTEKQYQYSNSKHSSIGTHIRHIIEFIKALSTANDAINYDARLRDIKVEMNQDFASKQLNIVIDDLLNRLKAQDLEQVVMVTMDNMCTKATFGREVTAVISHTIHHLAFINLVADQQGIVLDDDIGIAPATLEYQVNS